MHCIHCIFTVIAILTEKLTLKVYIFVYLLILCEKLNPDSFNPDNSKMKDPNYIQTTATKSWFQGWAKCSHLSATKPCKKWEIITWEGNLLAWLNTWFGVHFVKHFVVVSISTDCVYCSAVAFKVILTWNLVCCYCWLLFFLSVVLPD